MRRKTIILFTLCYLLSAICFSQPSITWQRLYDGPGNFRDYGWDICATTNGNFFLLGQNITYSGGYVIKINPYGDTIWTRLIDTINSCEAGVSSGDGGCIIASDNTTTKIDVNGNIIWHKRYGPLDYAQVFHVIKTSDAGYLACGRTISSGTRYAFKTDSLGNLRWQRTYTNGYFSELKSVTEAWDGGYVFAGSSGPSPVATVVMKTDTLGNPVWEKRYNVNNTTSVAHAINRITNGYITGGRTSGLIYFLKTDYNGDSTFTRQFPSTKPEYFGDMAVINENRYAIGLMRDSSIYIWDARAIITDSLGNIIRQRSFPLLGTESFIYISSMLSIPNGDLMFIGDADSGNSNEQDIWAARTDSNLNVPPIGIEANSNIIPAVSSLYPNYPNPFNSSTLIRFDVSKAGDVLIKVYDVLGRDVLTLVNQYSQAGNYSVVWNGMNFGSGIYFCSLYHNNNLISSQKLLLIR